MAESDLEPAIRCCLEKGGARNRHEAHNPHSVLQQNYVQYMQLAHNCHSSAPGIPSRPTEVVAALHGDGV